MSTTLLPPADDHDDADHPALRPKKERIIQPIERMLSPLVDEETKAHDDLLAELREKTARLAEQVAGKDPEPKQTLILEGDTDSSQPAATITSSNGSPSIHATDSTNNPAVTMVREKLARLYNKEPDAKEEVQDITKLKLHRSAHQRFMYDLTTSGKSLADIQTEWHNYYTALPDEEKHRVWQEFYEMQGAMSAYQSRHPQRPPAIHANKKAQRDKDSLPKPLARKAPNRRPADVRSVAEVKSQLLDKISAGGKLTAAHHVKSLLFGVGLAAFVGLVITFTFFNEVFIAPFISPATTVSATPIIGSQSGAVGPEPKIIIPKINLEVPVVFGMDTVEESAVQNALEDGVVHYATTPNPGEKGNAVIVGHSSNNILNSGKYKFAFVLLKRLEAEDTFFVQKDGIRYTYKVYRKEIVSPDAVSVLETQDRPNTITLITCDPPGTSINRLIIVAEQIDPNPAENKESTAITLEEDEANTLPSNAPSLWSRLWPF